MIEAFLVLSILFYITAGMPLLWLNPGLQALIEHKPILHRVFVLFFGLLALGLFGIQSRPGTPSVLVRILPRISPAFLFLAAVFVWTLSSWVRYETFHAGFDFAIFVQAVWNTAHGNFLYSSIKGGICLLGDHFSPLLAVLALPYTIWPDPKCLLLIQALAAASCVFPIDRLAKDRLQNQSLGVLFAAAFLFYLPVINAVRFDFPNLRKTENLKAAAVSEDWQIPVDEFMQATGSTDDFHAGADVEMIRVAEDDLRAHFQKLARVECLHAALRADGHENRRFNDTVRDREPAKPRFGLRICLEQFEHRAEV